MSEEIHGAAGGDVDDEMLLSAVDVGRFVRLAGKDPEGLVRMMNEYLDETRTISAMWPNLLQAGKEREVSEQLHMCKGGAAIFGFSRVMTLIADLEKGSLDPASYDAQAFERELALAERAIAALAGGRLT
jgi:HPt (histidine-containing phosphotransfer) domain-containing protein